MSVHELSRKEYVDLVAVNWSSLRHMAKSPAHYRYAISNVSPDSPARKRGRAVHIATLEPERFAIDCARWDGERRAGAAWKAFVEENAGRELLTADEYDQALAVADAVRKDAVASRYVSNGRAERAVTWNHRWPKVGGLAERTMALKGRIDFIADRGALVDLKTTRDASPGAFGRAVVNYAMHAQAAFYSDGYAAATGERLPFVFVAVEPEPPYGVIVYRVPDEILEMGREHYTALLDRLQLCRDSNAWPGYADSEQELALPRWAMPREDDDVSELGLTFNAGE